MEKEIYPLFSKPIYKTNIEISDLDLSNINWVQNYNNWISDNQYILDESYFQDLKNLCQKELDEYLYKVMGADPDVKIYITESWFNKTDKGQSHHRHWHPNSLYSVIVYIKGNTGSGYTNFITSSYDTIEYDILEPNLYNSRSWGFDGNQGDMLIFPSNTEHYVTPYEGEDPRITLSFNTFVKGKINKQSLTRLTLGE